MPEVGANSESEALDLVATFARCPNYPKERDGLVFFARGLLKAADSHKVNMSAIVERCAANSVYCPTDHDLICAAASIRDELDRAMDERKTARERFETSERGILDLVARGLLAPRCSLCGPAELYCEYGGAAKHSREHARYQDSRVNETMASSVPRVPLKPITDEDLQRVRAQIAKTARERSEGPDGFPI